MAICCLNWCELHFRIPVSWRAFDTTDTDKSSLITEKPRLYKPELLAVFHRATNGKVTGSIPDEAI
jgi:hypothetical protein